MSVPVTTLIAAVLRRISRQGDMHIRISNRTLQIIIRANGLDWESFGDDTHREIDAFALEALCVLAMRQQVA